MIIVIRCRIMWEEKDDRRRRGRAGSGVWPHNIFVSWSQMGTGVGVSDGKRGADTIPL